MKILLTSAGRRGYLVKYFMEAVEKQDEIHVANSSPNSTAMKYGHKSVTTPLIYSEEYIPFLKNYCVKNKIDALISLFDIDLQILSNNKKEFEDIGVEVIVSSKALISICNDKWLTFNYLTKKGFNTPLTFLSVVDAVKAVRKGIVKFPLIVKPRWGMGSISVFEAESLHELEILYKKTKNAIDSTYLSYESQEDLEKCVVIQEKLLGQEYGLDIINDLEGNYQVTIVKSKIAMRSGETDCAETVMNADLDYMGMQLSKALGHVGNLDVDAFIVDGSPYILEMNARFGGGYPFSHIAGVNLPLAITRWLKGERVDSKILTAEIGVIGYKDIVVINDRVKAAPPSLS